MYTCFKLNANIIDLLNASLDDDIKWILKPEQVIPKIDLNNQNPEQSFEDDKIDMDRRFNEIETEKSKLIRDKSVESAKSSSSVDSDLELTEDIYNYDR